MFVGRPLNEIAAEIHAANKKWWVDLETGEPIERNRGEMLMLAISELSEALEGIRKNLMDNHLPHRNMEEVELADYGIRMLDYAAGCGYDLVTTDVIDNPPDNKGECLCVLARFTGAVEDCDDPGRRISELIAAAEQYCRKFDLDFWGAIEEKFLYNQHRHDHTREARLAEGGKKF